GQQKHILFEVKVPPGVAGARRDLAHVDVGYANLITNKKASRRGAVAVEFTRSQNEVAAHENQRVMEAAVEALATFENTRAMLLRDAGDIAGAQKALKDNADYLAREAARLRSEKLKIYGHSNLDDATNLDEANWDKRRKTMRESQTKNTTQRGW